MTSRLSLLALLTLLFPFCNSTGIVWIRVSSPEQVAVQFEVIDRTNTSRYAISFTLQVYPRVPKEFVLPMPPSDPATPFPILDYSIQVRGGSKTRLRMPLLVNEPWTNDTYRSISTAIRFECLPFFYGAKCQTYCSSGQKCSTDLCSMKNCPINSECSTDNIEAKCTCRPGYSGENCDEVEVVHVSESQSELKLLIVILVVIIVILFKFLMIRVIFGRRTRKERFVSEPIVETVGDFQKDPSSIV
ncbi:unnamed protein product [Caenorhabditis sp. 36 PRJEB53466]|nr:unnamed protein product [Caenorhabditis sp. 36 PRJEB53466]